MFAVSQSGASCTLSFSPPSASVGAAAGTYSVAISAPAGCSWTAASNSAAWITVVSGGSGTGNGTVTYSVTANTGTKARTGQLLIGAQLYSITQAKP